MNPVLPLNPVNLFNDERVNDNLARQGYALVDVCTPQVLEELAVSSGKVLGDYSTREGRFFNFGQLNDFAMRRRSSDWISGSVLPLFKSLIRDDEAGIYAGTHLVKPPGVESGFDPHQDNTMVDENQARSFIIWMPLTAITMSNGPINVLPGSHRFGNIYRSVSIPWVFRKVKQAIIDRSVPVLLKVGQAMIFDSALIHYSSPNESDTVRIAVNSMVAGNRIPIIKCISRKHWLRSFIDIYEVGMDYYLDQFNEAKPASGSRLLDTVLYRDHALNERELMQMLAELDQDQ